MSQYRVFVEKKEMYATEAKSLCHDLNENLHLSLTNVRTINVYDVFNVNGQELETAKQNVLSLHFYERRKYERPSIFIL